jgi:hypothetical protein
MQAKQLMFILWPAFVVAGAAEALFFTVFDPNDLSVFGEPLHASRTTIYSVGFFMFWVFAAASSALTCFFQRSSADVNRPPRGGQAPAGATKAEDERASC